MKIKKFNESYSRDESGDTYWELAKGFVSYVIDNVEEKRMDEMFESFEVDIRDQNYFNDQPTHRKYLIKEIQTLCSNLHLNAEELK